MSGKKKTGAGASVPKRTQKQKNKRRKEKSPRSRGQPRAAARGKVHPAARRRGGGGQPRAPAGGQRHISIYFPSLRADDPPASPEQAPQQQAPQQAPQQQALQHQAPQQAPQQQRQAQRKRSSFIPVKCVVAQQQQQEGPGGAAEAAAAAQKKKAEAAAEAQKKAEADERWILDCFRAPPPPGAAAAAAPAQKEEAPPPGAAAAAAAAASAREEKPPPMKRPRRAAEAPAAAAAAADQPHSARPVPPSEAPKFAADRATEKVNCAYGIAAKQVSATATFAASSPQSFWLDPAYRIPTLERLINKIKSDIRVTQERRLPFDRDKYKTIVADLATIQDGWKAKDKFRTFGISQDGRVTLSGWKWGNGNERPQEVGIPVGNTDDESRQVKELIGELQVLKKYKGDGGDADAHVEAKFLAELKLRDTRPTTFCFLVGSKMCEGCQSLCQAFANKYKVTVQVIDPFRKYLFTPPPVESHASSR